MVMRLFTGAGIVVLSIFLMRAIVEQNVCAAVVPSNNSRQIEIIHITHLEAKSGLGKYLDSINATTIIDDELDCNDSNNNNNNNNSRIERIVLRVKQVIGKVKNIFNGRFGGRDINSFGNLRNHSSLYRDTVPTMSFDEIKKRYGGSLIILSDSVKP